VQQGLVRAACVWQPANRTWLVGTTDADGEELRIAVDLRGQVVVVTLM
jgi:hypothetical protein